MGFKNKHIKLDMNQRNSTQPQLLASTSMTWSSLASDNFNSSFSMILGHTMPIKDQYYVSHWKHCPPKNACVLVTLLVSWYPKNPKTEFIVILKQNLWRLDFNCVDALLHLECLGLLHCFFQVNNGRKEKPFWVHEVREQPKYKLINSWIQHKICSMRT